MRTLWEACQDDLRRAHCTWCGSWENELYEFISDGLEGGVVCRKCLSTTEYEEPERGLSLAERNK